jgi:hypothetical protein
VSGRALFRMYSIVSVTGTVMGSQTHSKTRVHGVTQGAGPPLRVE